MKFGILIALFTFGISVQGQLNCYVCENCEDFKNKTLLYCGPKTEVSTPVTPETRTETTETTETTEAETTTTEATTPETTEGTTISTDDPSNIVYSCYTIAVKGDKENKNQVNRGCLAIPNGENGCAVYLNQTGLAPGKLESCRLCQNYGCNSSAIARLSVLTILVMVVLQFLH